MSIALGIRFANFIICVSYYIVIWTVWLYHIFPCIINDTTFEKSYECKTCFDILYSYICHSKICTRYHGLKYCFHAKYVVIVSF